MLEIYAPFVAGTATSFEEQVPAVEAFRDRVTATTRTHPWVVAEVGGAIAGYAYASQHRVRAAYRWSTEVAVYVGPAFHRAGVGRALYSELIARLRAQRFVNAYAIITLPNDPSVRFHESLGFERCGLYPRAGFKHGRWHDVGWWALRLAEVDRPDDPLPPDPQGDLG
jgi:phosphinothricin acetyltransferase